MTLTFLPGNTSLEYLSLKFGRLTNCLPVGAHQDILGDSLQVAAELSFGIGNPARFLVIVRLLTVLGFYVGLHFQPRGGVCKGTDQLLDNLNAGISPGSGPVDFLIWPGILSNRGTLDSC